MKIAFLTFEYPPARVGGAGKYASRVTKGLAQHGHEVFVFSSTGETKVIENLHLIKVPYLNLPLLRVFTFWLVLTYKFTKEQWKGGNFDVLHVNEYVDFLLPAFFTKSIFRVVTVHHLAREVVDVISPTMKERFLNPGSEVGLVPLLEKLSIRRADHIIVVSRHTKKSLSKYYGVSEGLITVIHNGHEWDDKSSVPGKSTTKEKSPLKVLFVGRLEERKGVQFLLKSIKHFDKSCDVNARFILVGKGNHQQYRQLSNFLGIDHLVSFEGYLEEERLKKLYANSDIFVLPSKLEGFGLVLLEAIEFGLPVIGTNRGGIPEVIEEYNNGTIVRYGEESELSKAVCNIGKKLLNGDMDYPNISHVKEKYNWERNVQMHIKLFQNYT